MEQNPKIEQAAKHVERIAEAMKVIVGVSERATGDKFLDVIDLMDKKALSVL